MREARSLNEMLRRALFRARLTEEDVAAHLGVDPKTVRRWLEGRMPYPRHRLALSHLLGADEAHLWPEVHAARAARSWPEEVKAVYPHRWAVPRELWHQLFESAQREIDVLAYSGLFLAEDVGLLNVFASKACAGVSMRIALGDPDGPNVAERGDEEGTAGGMAAKIRNALILFRPLLDARNVEIRLHRITLYNSIYRADDNLVLNQHIYGVAAANAPVLHLSMVSSGDMFSSYIDSFKRIWSDAQSLVDST
jgi:transcriptional regulator with XRE-family HTH domain